MSRDLVGKFKYIPVGFYGEWGVIRKYFRVLLSITGCFVIMFTSPFFEWAEKSRGMFFLGFLFFIYSSES
jgi:hypothetical protein